MDTEYMKSSTGSMGVQTQRNAALIVSLNTRYEHENPSPWYLKAAWEAQENHVRSLWDVCVLSKTINDNIGHLFGAIVRAKPDLVAFSCYIWNREMTLKLCRDLAEAFPHLILVAGGPEVSFGLGAEDYIAAGVHFTLSGEGEEKFPYLLKRLSETMTADVPTVGKAATAEAGSENPLFSSKSLSEMMTEDDSAVVKTTPSCENETVESGQQTPRTCLHPERVLADERLMLATQVMPLPADKLHSPLCDDYLKLLGGRIAYVESSRGCPFQCSYCLSSESKGLTWMPLARVYCELDALVSSGAKVVKFVDRTFNLKEDRTLAIWRYLLRFSKSNVVFHFEISPDLLSDTEIQLLSEMPVGLVQIEAGFQTVHAETLTSIHRLMDVKKAMQQLKKVLEKDNVHVHADLIAGLPGEDLNLFATSLNELTEVFPHHLQLGFLKLLRGTRMDREADAWGFVRRGYPPYEVIASQALPVIDMLHLKDIEETLERFYNSGRFLFTMQQLLLVFETPYALYAQLAESQRENSLFERAVSSETLFRFLLSFIERTPFSLQCGVSREVLHTFLCLDFVCAHKNPFLPEWLTDGEEVAEVKTNDLHTAYPIEDLDDRQIHSPIKNRFFARRIIWTVPKMRGVRVVEALPMEKSGFGTTTSAESMLKGSVIVDIPADDTVIEADANKFLILIDTKRVHPVLGRPELVVLHRNIFLHKAMKEGRIERATLL